MNDLPLKRGDVVAVEASPGHDIGIVSLTGELALRQMRRTGFVPLQRRVPQDLPQGQALRHRALAGGDRPRTRPTMIQARQIAADMGLNMKIGDVEYQGDKIKAIFYYIADERVDFRELIKVFAERFRIRIEMKQIGARREAGRIGGLGACGRELCCASWIAGFSSVTTGAARMQDISLNPQKLAGQCSKLKCCMMYEYDTYVDARKGLPARARAVADRRWRVLPAQDRHSGRHDDFRHEPRHTGQCGHAARGAREGDHRAEPCGYEGRTLAGPGCRAGGRGARLPGRGGQHHALRQGAPPQEGARKGGQGRGENLRRRGRGGGVVGGRTERRAACAEGASRPAATCCGVPRTARSGAGANVRTASRATGARSARPANRKSAATRRSARGCFA